MLIFGQILRDRSNVSASISLTELKNHLVMQVLRMQCCLLVSANNSEQQFRYRGNWARHEARGYGSKAAALALAALAITVLRQPDKAAQISVDLPLVLPIVKMPLVLMVKVTRPT